MGCLPQAAWPERLLSEKSGRCGIAADWRACGALPMIDRGDIRQAIDRERNIWASLLGAGYGQFEHKADSLIAKLKKRAERSERLMASRVTLAIISALVICCASSSARLWAVNHCRDTLRLQSPARQKCQRTEAGERGNY